MDILSQIMHSVSEKRLTPSHIKEGETVMEYPLHTYTMYCLHRNPQLIKLKLN